MIFRRLPPLLAKLAAVATAAAAGDVYTERFLSDPSFDGADPDAPAWRLAAGAPRAARAALDTNAFVSPPAALRIECGDAADAETVAESPRFSSLPDGAFELAAQVRIEGELTRAQLVVVSFDAAGDECGRRALDLPAAEGWNAVTGAVALAGGAVDARLRLELRGPGRAWLDDVRIAVEADPRIEAEADARPAGVAAARDAGVQPCRWFPAVAGSTAAVLAVLSPSGGAPLLWAEAGGAWVLRAAPQEGPAFRVAPPAAGGGPSALDACASAPGQRAGVFGAPGGIGAVAVSADGGLAWTNCVSRPFGDAAGGALAVSATDPANLVWMPRGPVPPFATADGGRTWTPGRHAPIGLADPVHTLQSVRRAPAEAGAPRAVPLASDRVQPGVFYLADARDGRVYRSKDSGATWRHVGRLASPGAPAATAAMDLAAAPGLGGELWAAWDQLGLFRSTDGGESWRRFDGIERVRLVGFGAPASENAPPTAFVLGRLRGDDGLDAGAGALYRSDDWGETWRRLGGPGAQDGAAATCLAGDGTVAGRLFVGTSDHGLWVAEPLTVVGNPRMEEPP